MKKSIFLLMSIAFAFHYAHAQKASEQYNWKRISTEYGDIELPNKGKFQTASLVADFLKNGKDEFIIFEKTESPSVVMYVHTEGVKFEKHIIEKRKISAGEGADYCDIDGDGDLDIAIGSEETNHIWWWENPYPDYKDSKSWKRNYIKKDGEILHHDIIFGDFDGDKEIELVFWNEGCQTLFVAEKPSKPDKADDWPYAPIYSYATDGQMPQRSNGSEILTKGVNYHGGIAKADIDQDGILDIVTAGMWMKYKNGKYISNPIDLSYIGAQINAGQLIEGGRPEIVMVSGHGIGPLVLYQFEENTWVPNIIDKTTRRAHTLELIDFDKDGDLDIFTAEMKVKEVINPSMFVYLNNGNGNFEKIIISSNYGSHNTGIGDINGDSNIDIIGKPYAWDTPRIDIMLNLGKK